MKINFLKYNSLLVIFYLFYHILPKIFQILKLDESYCKYFLILSLFPIIFELKNINIKFIKIIFLFTMLVLVNSIFTKAIVIEILFHIKDIYFYGISAAIVGSLKIKKNYLEKYIKIFSYINIFIYSYIVFYAKNIYYEKMDYMVYGYVMLQSAIFLMFLQVKNKKILFIDFLLIFYSLFMILLFGNRFAILIGVFSVLVFYWYYERKKIKKIILYFLIVLGGVSLYFNLKSILIFMNNLLLKFDYKVYGILRLIRSLELKEKGADITSGRIDIYLEAIEVIKNNLFGIGIWGYLSEIKYAIKGLGYRLGYYPHNIFIEIGMHWGLIGLIIFIIFILKAGYRIINMKNSTYKLFLISLILLNTKLLLSDTYISYNMFWIFWAVYFNKSYKYG